MNAYAKVMDVLSHTEVTVNWRVLVFEIAKTHPGAVVKAAESLRIVKPDLTWVATATAFIEAGEQLQAIKAVRAGTAWGLIESKNWCDDQKKKLG